MPSPFPGMDPFLEHPAFFPGLHDRFIAYLSEALQACLPAPYYAEINERLWVDASERLIGPDVDEGRETYLEIRSPLENGERVVATIEVLSLTNKTPGPKSRALYLQKQREVIDSDSHLIEIDLLREGTHTTAVPFEHLRKKAPPFEYHVCVHAFDKFGTFAVYTLRLADHLPSITVPLLPGDGGVPIDLQAVFDRCYDTGPYHRRVRYELSRIVPPLHDDLLEWATKLLREKGRVPPPTAEPES